MCESEWWMWVREGERFCVYGCVCDIKKGSPPCSHTNRHTLTCWSPVSLPSPARSTDCPPTQTLSSLSHTDTPLSLFHTHSHTHWISLTRIPHSDTDMRSPLYHTHTHCFSHTCLLTNWSQSHSSLPHTNTHKDTSSTISHTHSHSHSHTHCNSCFSLTHIHTDSTLSHRHTHTLPISLFHTHWLQSLTSLSHTQTYQLSLTHTASSFSLTQTCTHTDWAGRALKDTECLWQVWETTRGKHSRPLPHQPACCKYISPCQQWSEWPLHTPCADKVPSSQWVLCGTITLLYWIDLGFRIEVKVQNLVVN